MNETVRPPWEDFISGTSGAYLYCGCGQTLVTFEQTREHWQRGHFDYVPKHENKDGLTPCPIHSVDVKHDPLRDNTTQVRYWCPECMKQEIYDLRGLQISNRMSIKQLRAVCRYLRGEVERLEARVNSGAETVICRHHNLWVDVYDTKKSYRCPDCGLEYDEVTHE